MKVPRKQRSVPDPGRQHAQAAATVPRKRLDPPVEKPERGGQLAEDFFRFVVPSLLLICVLCLAGLFPNVTIIIVVCLAMFAPSVLLHELGHYFVAKRAGMQIRAFSIGFGRSLWSKEHKGVTWSLNMLPFGGSVAIAGMTVEDVEQNNVDPQKAFIYKPPMTRLAVVLVGVALNAMLAWGALTAAILLVTPGRHSISTYLTAPIEGLILLGSLIGMGVQSLGVALFNWASQDVGSVLSLPSAFSEGATAFISEGVPLGAYLFMFLGALNLSLMLFNMLPLYPLDGYYGTTAIIDRLRLLRSSVASRDFAPLSAWQLRWFSRSTGAFLGIFIISVFVRDVLRMM